MKRNAILFSKVDREDGWVTSGLVFKVTNTSTYEDAYNEIKDKLESKEVIDYIIEEACLADYLFDNDETFELVETNYYRSLCLTFQNSEGEEVEYKMSADFVLVV